MYKFFIFIITAVISLAAVAETRLVQVKHHQLQSKALADNRIQLDSVRDLRVYLPPGYNKNHKHYAVIYYIPFNAPAEDAKLLDFLALAFREKRIPEFILVSGNFTTPGSLNFFGNNSISGRWLDHIRQEIVPFIDEHYRTIPHAASRGISGHFLGGYAAIRLAMFHPDIFGSVYALHPVGTDIGERSMLYNADWNEIHKAKSMSDLKAPYTVPFVAMAQAYLPNPDNPPFYADFIVESIDGKLTPNPANIRKLTKNFYLANLIPDLAENLHQLRGIKFDWGREDVNQAHVYSARRFSLLLRDFGVEHDAEEYNGNGWDENFDKYGRLYQEMLPFFDRYLEFDTVR
jgi:hypothetical protein